MSLSAADLYKVHTKNLTAVQDGLAHIERQLNAVIGASDSGASGTLTRIFLLLAGTWTECRLKKVLFEPAGFTFADRRLVEDERSQIDRWIKSLEIGYRKRYRVLRAPLSERSLEMTAWIRYEALRSRIDTDLRPIIEMRNTLAHGQWARALNNNENDYSPSMMRTLQGENALTVKYRLALSRHIANLLHDLVSATSFERDFDQHYRRITDVHNRLQRVDFAAWQQPMIDKHARGRARHQAEG